MFICHKNITNLIGCKKNDDHLVFSPVVIILRAKLLLSSSREEKGRETESCAQSNDANDMRFKLILHAYR